MGLTRTDIFTEEQNQLAQIFKALAHPARIAILQQLFKKQSCICGDLVDEIGLAQATISQHLRELKKMKLIVGTIDGPKVCYCLNYDRLDTIRSQFSEFLSKEVPESTKCC